MPKKRGLGRAARGVFLEALLERGTIAGAARDAKVDRPAVYATMRLDPVFALAVEEARELGVEALKDEAYARAMGWKVRASDILLMFLIKAGRPLVPRQLPHPRRRGGLR